MALVEAFFVYSTLFLVVVGILGGLGVAGFWSARSAARFATSMVRLLASRTVAPVPVRSMRAVPRFDVRSTGPIRVHRIA
jgi:hypothetical protein